MKRMRIGIVAVVTLALTVVCWLFFVSRDSTEKSLIRRYSAGDLSGTLHGVAVLTNPTPNSLILAADCFRQLGLTSQFSEGIERARAKAAAAEDVELALAMHKIQGGQLDGSPRELIQVLQSAGALASDAWSVVVLGMFATNRLREAKELLNEWKEEHPDSAELSYLSAVYANVNGDENDAEAKLIETIDLHPKHELAWLALSEFYSRPPNVRFQQAELVLEGMVARFPHNSDVRLRLAKIQRRLGRTDIAVLQALDPATEVVVMEQAKIYFDQGKLSEALKKIESVGLAVSRDFNRLTDSAFSMSLNGRGELGGELTQQVAWQATALALSGDYAAANEVFDVAADRTARLRRLQDLEVKRSLFPRQQSLIDEANAIVSPAYTPAYPTLAQLSEPSPAADEPFTNEPGFGLYQRHCAACHGRRGDGRGRAAANLFPAPRSFRDEPVRLISTENLVASDADLARTIRDGESGTSMPAFKQLSDGEIESLTKLIREFIVAGLRERYTLEAAGGTKDSESELQWILARSQPGRQVVVPELTRSDSMIENGRELFQSIGCANCHASADQPAKNKRLFDSLGRPITAPRLDSAPFHGGQDPRDLYLRIMLGIPGTPHPALTNTSATNIQALVAYILSARPKFTSDSTNYQRSLQ